MVIEQNCQVLLEAASELYLEGTLTCPIFQEEIQLIDLYSISPPGLGAGTNRTKLRVTEEDGTYETQR
jgi:hypothetical protein